MTQLGYSDVAIRYACGEDTYEFELWSTNVLKMQTFQMVYGFPVSLHCILFSKWIWQNVKVSKSYYAVMNIVTTLKENTNITFINTVEEKWAGTTCTSK